MTNAIIGAKGEMGKNLLFPLLKQIGQVITVDRDSTPKEWKNAWKADVIWLSIPREEVPKILYKVKLKSQQLIVDVCSIKRRIIDVIASTGATHLSLHPLHGPYIALNGQKWALIKTGAEHNKFAKQILDFLRGQGIQILEPVSENEHDFMMGVVFSFHKQKDLKPNLVIQKMASVDKVFPKIKKKIRVGIHGIEGSFSHESLLRLCEELGVMKNKI